MQTIATITSKRQLTIPSVFFNKIGLKKNQKVVLKEQNGKIIVSPSANLVEKLSGSVKIPKGYKNIGIDKLITKAKEEYFKSNSE